MTCKIIFKNDKSRELSCDADRIKIENGIIRLFDFAGKEVAVIPQDNVLYIKKLNNG